MPRRRGSLWLPLDVNFLEDDRIVEAGEKSTYLYLAMCLAAKRLGTDGLLTARQMERLHVAGWRSRLDTLVRLELVEDCGADLWGIRSWFRHNERQAKVEQIREKDRERKRGTVPSGIRPESVRSRDVEKRREEKREVENADCEHGVDRHASCSRCALRLVNE